MKTSQKSSRGLACGCTILAVVAGLCAALLSPPAAYSQVDLTNVSNINPSARATAAALTIGTTQHPFTDNNTPYIVWMPNQWTNKIWLRTLSGGKDDTSLATSAKNYFSFKVTKKSTVAVAFNHYKYGEHSTGTGPHPGPDWLTQPANGWTYAYHRIEVKYAAGTDEPNRPMYWDLWVKTFAAGSTVYLGGNNGPTALAAPAGVTYYDPKMYFVLVDPDLTTTAGKVMFTQNNTPHSQELSDDPPFYKLPGEPRVMILFDNSSSLVNNPIADTDNRNTVQVARDVIVNFIDMADGVQVGLSTYDAVKQKAYSSTNNNCNPPRWANDIQVPARWPTWTPGATCGPCTTNSVTSAQIFNHPMSVEQTTPPKDPPIRTELKYGTKSGVYNGITWSPLPPWPNYWLWKYFGAAVMPNEDTCWYHNEQGIEGMNVNDEAMGLVQNRFTPIYGSLMGLSEYYTDFYFPQEELTTSPFYNEAVACDNQHFNIFISDGEEYCFASQAEINSAGTLLFSGLEYKVKTYVIGLGNLTGVFDALATAGGTGPTAYTATNAGELTAALQSIFGNLKQGTFAGSSVALETDSVTTDDYLYRATFYPSDWHGDVEAYKLQANGALPAGYPAIASRTFSVNQWITSGVNWSTRSVYITPVVMPTEGVLNQPPVAMMKIGGPAWDPANGVDAYLTHAEQEYIMGNPYYEIRSNNGGSFRSRPNGPLGDVIYSSPVYVGPPPFNYDFNDYATFKSDKATRANMLYFGANDGMLHAVDPNPALGGKIKWSYIPRDVLPKLKQLVNPLYSHNYFVDGPAITQDVFTQGAWRTLLIFPLRGGGISYQMLDVTNPDVPLFYWQYSNDDWNPAGAGNHANILGFGIDKAKIARVGDKNSSTWVMFIPSGLENTDGKGHVLALNLDSRTLMADIPLTTSACVSLSVVDAGKDGFADCVYAGDLGGNVWKVDITAPNPGNWAIAFKKGNVYFPLFKATDSLGNPQPITSGIEVAKSCNDVALFFGTGKFYSSTDRLSTSKQSFYAILDNKTNFNFTRTTQVSGSPLMIARTLTTSGTAPNLTRTISGALDFQNCIGHYIDLTISGERVTVAPRVWYGYVTFLSGYVDVADVCNGNGYGWFFDLPFASSCTQRNETMGNKPLTITYVNTGVPTGLSLSDKYGAYIYDHKGGIQNIPPKSGSGSSVQPRGWKELFY